MGSFSCNYCSDDKEEQEKEALQTFTTKAAEYTSLDIKNEDLQLSSKETGIKKIKTENIDFYNQKLTIVSEPLDSIEINETKILYILPEFLSKRENIENYYQIFPTLLCIGGSSKIFVGRNEKGKFAIKQILKGGVAKPNELIREANISLQLNHKNIIKYYEIYEDINFVNIVMELGDTDLFELITKSPNCIIPEDLSIEILIQVFDVIDYLHTEEHIVHCDIKPENFVVKFENNYPFLKLIDFGSARKMGTGGESKLKNFCGTKEYIAPEIFENNTFNEKVDEWAAGILMFNLLTGCDPFMNQNNSDYRDNILFKEIISI